VLNAIERGLVLLHRYLGIAVGPLTVVWCLTGVVMMYAPYPQLTEAERVAHLAPLQWQGCCRIAPELVATNAKYTSFEVEGLRGSPTLRLTDQSRRIRLVDLVVAHTIDVDEQAALAVANAYTSTPERTRLQRQVDHDQWTVQGSKGADRPLYKLALSDGLGTEVYISGVSGKAVQVTNIRSRLLSWVGAVPHWIYFTALRENVRVWTQVVIWTSLLGSFLALVGLYIGVRRLRLQRQQWSPYRGFHFWHHSLGLGYGIFVLSWVVSGLISMNPWGFLEGGDLVEPKRLASLVPTIAQIDTSVTALAASLPPDVVSVRSAPLHGELFMVASRADGSRFRVDAKARAAPLTAVEREFIVRTLVPTGELSSLTEIQQEDAYYFSHHRELVVLPAFRLIAADAQKTRYYLDPVSGLIRSKVDEANQMYRWLHQGLHRLDFTPMFRSRPFWDVLMLSLLLGATAVCAIGTYLGLRRTIRLH
jgi:PepSY-associated TM region